jgi:cobalt transporter subunit CbtA
VSVFRSTVLSSAVVGLIVGSIITVLQHFGTVPLILKGEIYEAALEKAILPNASTEAAPVATMQEHGGHQHQQAVWEPKNGWERNSYTLLANILTAIGFALLLAGIYSLRGRTVSWHEGLFWGLGGFIVFTIAPGVGLPPTLPGVPGAPLELRQLWWLATVAATGSGLALLVFKRAPWSAVLGVGLMALPHVVGAPQPADFHTDVPEMLSRQFVTAVMLTSLVFWTLLGSLTAVIHRRFIDKGLSDELG